ncbi:hypothetical protein D3C80_801930 [compost metagenome]
MRAHAGQQLGQGISAAEEGKGVAFAHARQVLHGAGIGDVVFADKAQPTGQVFGQPVPALVEQRDHGAGQGIHALEGLGHAACAAQAGLLGCAGVFSQLQLFGPGLQHQFRREGTNHITAGSTGAVGGKAADVVGMPVGRDHRIELARALGLDVFGNGQQALALGDALGHAHGTEVDQYMAAHLAGVVETQQEAVAKTDLVGIEGQAGRAHACSSRSGPTCQARWRCSWAKGLRRSSSLLSRPAR